MRLVSTLTAETEALMGGTPEQQLQAQRERQAAEHAHAIVSTKEELRRSDLEFGRHWIEHLPTGRLFWVFGGDPIYSPGVAHYFVARDGTPTMLEPADPPSLAEFEKRKAARAKRRADREAEARARREQMMKTARK
jgi:hypothetical protein